MPDIAIIGAGPAGAVAAILLARAGWQVTLIEQSTFPRDKVCGECLSSLGLAVLDRLDLLSKLRPFHPAVLLRTALHSPDGSSAVLPLPAPIWGISRAALDLTLLNAAADAGADILQPARCESINTHPHLCLRIRDLQTNQIRDLTPSFALLADGKAALLPSRPKPTGDFGLKAHFTHIDAPPQTIELFGVSNAYGGLAPIEPLPADPPRQQIPVEINGVGESKGVGSLCGPPSPIPRWNAAFSIPADRLSRAHGNLDALFQSLVSENRTLRKRFRNARRLSPWLTSPLPRFPVSRNWPTNLIPIGNAAAALEPVGGEGMGLAMRSAELAAESLLDAVAQFPASDEGALSNASRQLQSRFAQLWRTRRLACRAVAVLMSHPPTANLLAPAAAAADSLAAHAMTLIGKNANPSSPAYTL